MGTVFSISVLVKVLNVFTLSSRLGMSNLCPGRTIVSKTKKKTFSGPQFRSTFHILLFKSPFTPKPLSKLDNLRYEVQQESRGLLI